MKVFLLNGYLPSKKKERTHGGNKKSSRKDKSSPYPNFRNTVHVVSSLPRWINNECKNAKPILDIILSVWRKPKQTTER